MESCRFFLRKADGPEDLHVDFPLSMVKGQVSTLAWQILGQKPSSVAMSELATRHYVYHVRAGNTPREFYLKIPKTRAAARTLFLEQAIYSYLSRKVDTGIEVIDYEDNLKKFPFPFLMITKAKGVVLRSIDIDRGDYTKFIHAFIQKAMEIHRFCPLANTQDKSKSWGLLDIGIFAAKGRWQGAYHTWEEYLRSCLQEQLAFTARHKVITSAESRDINNHLTRERQGLGGNGPALLHGDLGAHNIFVDENSYAVSAVIDWEDALLGDPLFDMALFATFYRMEEFADFILKDYAGMLHVPKKSLWRRFWVYYLRICLAKSVLLLKHSQDKEIGESTMKPKIKLALSQLKAARV